MAKGESSTGMVVGIVFGGLGLVALGAGAVWLFLKGDDSGGGNGGGGSSSDDSDDSGGGGGLFDFIFKGSDDKGLSANVTDFLGSLF